MHFPQSNVKVLQRKLHRERQDLAYPRNLGCSLSSIFKLVSNSFGLVIGTELVDLLQRPEAIPS
jgi:hypothetical protein